MQNTRKYDIDGNLVYDLSLFTERDADFSFNRDAGRPDPGKTQSQQRKTKENRIRIGRQHIDLFVLGIMVVALSVFSIFLRAKVNEKSVELAVLDRELLAAQAEHTYLEYELESLYSYEKLEEAAHKIGMEKPSATQIRYYKIPVRDVTEVKGKIVFKE